MPGYRRGLRLPGSAVAVAGASGPVGGAVVAALAAAGARPEPVTPADPTDADAVRAAARAAAARAGRLDGWVQCAAGEQGGLDGALTRLPTAALRRALDDAVLGAAYGARAAVAELSAGGGGVLAVVVSAHGQVARPDAAPQAMAAAAVRAMAGALRQELRLAGVRGVAVTAVLVPAAADARRVAATVLGRLRRPGLEKVAGGPAATALVHGHALVPAATELWVAWRSRGAGARG